MTRKLILFFSGAQKQIQFSVLSRSLGVAETHELYRFLAERMLTEVYPLNDMFSLILASHQSHLELSKWLGSNWDQIDLSGVEPGHAIFYALKQVFSDEKTDKALCLMVGHLDLDESKICSWFDRIQKDQVVCGKGSDGSLMAFGVHKDHLTLFENLDFCEPETPDLIEIRVEHYKKSCFHLPVPLVPTNLTELSTFRESLPPEHFIAAKIDHLVLGKLQAGVDEDFNPELTSSLQIDFDEPFEKDQGSLFD